MIKILMAILISVLIVFMIFEFVELGVMLSDSGAKEEYKKRGQWVKIEFAEFLKLFNSIPSSFEFNPIYANSVIYRRSYDVEFLVSFRRRDFLRFNLWRRKKFKIEKKIKNTRAIKKFEYYMLNEIEEREKWNGKN